MLCSCCISECYCCMQWITVAGLQAPACVRMWGSKYSVTYYGTAQGRLVPVDKGHVYC